MGASERGAALLIATIVLLVVLVAGLAAVSVTSGQLSRSRGFRSQVSTDACAEAGIARLRARIPNVPAFDDTESSVTDGATTLTYRAGHLDGDGAEPYRVLDNDEYDAAAMYSGENISNFLGTSSGDLSTGVHLVRLTAVCGGPMQGKREVEVVLRYGIPVTGR